ncbi:MAG: hypothetical protein WKH64_17670 [Chloroflexia bacterium]
MSTHPGNPGAFALAQPLATNEDGAACIARAAADASIDPVVVGPEVYLAVGLVDECDRLGVPALVRPLPPRKSNE